MAFKLSWSASWEYCLNSTSRIKLKMYKHNKKVSFFSEDKVTNALTTLVEPFSTCRTSASCHKGACRSNRCWLKSWRLPELPCQFLYDQEMLPHGILAPFCVIWHKTKTQGCCCGDSKQSTVTCVFLRLGMNCTQSNAIICGSILNCFDARKWSHFLVV